MKHSTHIPAFLYICLMQKQKACAGKLPVHCVILPDSYHLHGGGNAVPACSGATGALDMVVNKLLPSLDYREHSLILIMC